MNREEKEKTYIEKQTQLQLIWNNPINEDWDFIKEWSEEELDKNIKETIGQIKFQKKLGFFKGAIKIIIVLAVVGLIILGLGRVF